MLDNVVRSIALEARAIADEKTVVWGHKTITSKVMKMAIRQPEHSSRRYLQKQRECIWTLRGLIIGGKLLAYKYWGNDMELSNNQNRGIIKVSLLDDIQEYEAKALASEIVGSLLEPSLKVGQIVKRFLAIDENKLEQIDLTKIYPPHYGDHFRDLNRLRQFAQHPTHCADAFHIWVCELNNIDYFVTADRKIKKYFSDTLKIKINVKIVDPTELLSLLNEPIQRMPIERIPYAMSALDLDD